MKNSKTAHLFYDDILVDSFIGGGNIIVDEAIELLGGLSIVCEQIEIDEDEIDFDYFSIIYLDYEQLNLLKAIMFALGVNPSFAMALLDDYVLEKDVKTLVDVGKYLEPDMYVLDSDFKDIAYSQRLIFDLTPYGTLFDKEFLEGYIEDREELNRRLNECQN